MKAANHFVAAGLVGLLGLSSTGEAATITVASVTGSPGETVQVPVMVSGGESLTDMAGIIIVGGGGTLLENPPAPLVTAVDYTGTIWEGALSGFDAFLDTSLDTNEIVGPSLNLKANDEHVLANGLLLTFDLDLSGFSIGQTFTLSMGDKDLQETELQFLGTTLPCVFEDGLVTVVPEPIGAVSLMSGILMLALMSISRLRRFR